ncbi:MAG TPA: proline dehydrogenase family protein [Nitrososphaerales archaeon]|nr:proline dehydrogenase family protein [Nitrososphaerales archaeon]
MGLQELLLLRVARRWIAGVDLDTAMKDSSIANKKGIGVVVNFLGEEIKDSATADAQVQEYLGLQNAIAANSIMGFASVKLTQLGMGTDDEGAKRRLETIAANAESHSQQLFVDMESSPLVDRTLSMYLERLSKYRGMGLAFQSYLRRSKSDLGPLLDKGARIRLVKGAYRESRDVVFHSRKEINQNFTDLMRVLFERGDNFAIATHDSALVDEARKMAESKHVDFRFEMLKGIRNDLKAELVASGYKVFEYLPYGGRWMAYSKRRVTEHPSNIWLLLRSLV